MARSYQFALDLTIEDSADPIAVADAVLDRLCSSEDAELPGVESADGCEPTPWPLPAPTTPLTSPREA